MTARADGVAKSLKKVIKYTCPCCRYKTLDEEPPGTFDIFNICFWEDDNFQYRDPNYEGGANHISLRQAQKNYIMFGACKKDDIELVRNLNETDIKDPNWKPLFTYEVVYFNPKKQWTTKRRLSLITSS